MSRRFRLLPLTILAALMLLGLKLTEVWQAGEDLFTSVRPAVAQDDAPPEIAEPAGNQAPAPAEGEPAPMVTEGPPPPAETPAPDAPGFTPEELEVLQNLAARRAEIEARAEELEMRERVLAATEQRINERVALLEQLKGEIEGLLARYDEQQENELKNVVKVYESMKAKDAARIFDQMDMPTLLDIVQRMRPQKVAGVLAEMDPLKARAVTEELAQRRPLEVVVPGG